MHDEAGTSYVLYRLETAKDELENAKLMYEYGRYKASINRSYYSIFHAMRAVLAIDRVDFKKHSGVISYFMKEYIKSGIFDKRYSNIIRKASAARNNSDYEDFYQAEPEEALQQYNEAEDFYNAVQKYITLL